MNRLLLYVSLFGSLLTANAQADCASAALLVSGNTYTIDAVDGAFPEGGVVCTFVEGNSTTPNAVWYYFTTPSSGMLTIDAGLETNTPPDDDAFDTRLRVLSGSCGAFTCITQNDDINYPADLRSRIVNFPVLEGQTYYIVFDDRWSDTAFDFEFTFTSATCFPVSGGYAFEGDPTPTSAVVSWAPPVLGTPVGYVVEYGETGFELGTGITLTTDEEMIEFTDLEGSTIYEFYIMTDCGEGNMSIWTEAVSFTTPFGNIESLPYEFGFEPDPSGYNGGWSYPVADDDNGWFQYVEDPDIGVSPHEGTQYVVAAALLNASTDIWLFSRPVSLDAGQQINISFYLSKFTGGGTGGVNNMDVTIGTEMDAEAQTVIHTFADYAEEEYTLQNISYTAESAGTYFIGFNYTAPSHTETDNGALLMDTFSIDSAAGIAGFENSGFSIMPNPTSGYLYINNFDNILIREIEIADINGRIIKNIEYNTAAGVEISMGDLSAGMYLMTVSSDNGIFTKKIIKN